MTDMRRLIFILIVTAVAAVHASAQGQVREVPDTAAVHVQADSAAIVRYMSYDSLMTYLKGHRSPGGEEQEPQGAGIQAPHIF